MTDRLGSTTRYPNVYVTTANINDARCKSLTATTGIMPAFNNQRNALSPTTGTFPTTTPVIFQPQEGEAGILSFTQPSGSLTGNNNGGSFLYVAANGTGTVTVLGRTNTGCQAAINVTGSAGNYTYSMTIQNTSGGNSALWRRTRIN
jgi:hypothetical protein